MKRAIRVFLLATLCLMLCLSASAEQTERQYVTLGQTDLTVTAGETTSVYFRAPEAGAYAFYSTSTKDPEGALYAEDETGALTQLARDDDSGSNNNFLMECDLEANQVVRLDTHYLSGAEGTLPITIVQMQAVASDAALTLGETELDLPEHTYVEYPFEPGEQPGYYSFTMSTSDATVALYDQNGACIYPAANAIPPFSLNGGQRYTVRVGLRAHLTARKASLTINRYDGALKPVANVCIDGVPVEEGMTVPAYRALTVTFDGVDNAQYYEVYVGGNTWRVESGQPVVVSRAPGGCTIRIEAKADNWLSSTFYHNVRAEETEAQPELTLSVDSAVNLEDDLVTFTLAQTEAPATLWMANGNQGVAPQKMLLLDGAYVLKHREYSGTYQVWATDALGRASNRLEVAWNPPAQDEYPVYDSLTHLTLNGEPLVSGASITAGAPLEVGFNLVTNAQRYRLWIERNGQMVSSREVFPNGSKPRFNNLSLTEGVWQLHVIAYDSNYQELCASEIYELNAVAPTQFLPLSVDRTQAYVDESVTLTSSDDTKAYCWAVNKAGNSLPNYVGMLGRGSDTLSLGPNNGGYPCQMEYYISDDNGRVSAPVTVDFLYRGTLQTPTVSIGDTALTQEVFMDLAAGQEYTLTVSEQENATRYHVQVTYVLRSGMETVVNYEGTSNTFTMPEDVITMRVSAWATAPGWETGNTGVLTVRVGTVADSFASVTVNGEEWQENMTVRSLEETFISWNHVRNAAYYVVNFAFNEMQGATSGYSMSEPLFNTRFGLSADCVYFSVNAYDASGSTLCSTPFMRLSIDRTPPEASFTLTADRESAYIYEPIQFTMERPARLFYATPNDRFAYQIGGGTTSVTQSWSTVGDVTCFAIDDAGNYSNIVTVHYDTKGALPEPQMYVNDQPFDDKMIFEPGETYTLRAECSADGLTDPVSYHFSISYYDGNGQFISRDEINEAEITTSVPEAASRCNMSIYCSAPGWQPYNRGFNLMCGVASSAFDSVLVNGEPYVEDMTVAPFDEVRISWNYIAGAEHFNIQISDPQGHTTGYWSHYTSPYQDIMIDDQREWIDVDIEAVAEGGVSLCSSTLRLQVGDVAPESAFTLTSNAQEIYIGESVRFSADRLFALYQTVPYGPVMQRVFGQTTVANCTIGQVGTYTFIAVDSEGNRSNSVTVTAKTKGKLPTPSLYLNDELLDSNTPTFLTPGETYTLRVECSADDLTDPINYFGSLQFFNAENVNISTLNVQSEITFTVPEDAVRGHGNFNAQATGWEGSATFRSFICGVASSAFDSVLVNGEEWQENMTVRSLEETSISWNYITNATHYAVDFAFNETQEVNNNYNSMSEPLLNTRFGLSADYVYFRVNAYDASGNTLCSTPFMRLSIDHTPPEASFTLTADRDSAYIDEPIQFTMERPARLFYSAPNDGFVYYIGGGTTSVTHSWVMVGDVTCFAIDDAGNYSNIVTVHYDTKGKLPTPSFYLNDELLDINTPTFLTPGETYTLRAECSADGLTDLVSYHFSISYYDGNGQFISRDEINEAEITTSVPEAASRCNMSIYCSAPGWQSYNRGFNLPCGAASSTFDSVLVNGEPYVEGMTVAPFDAVRISWNYIAGAENFHIQISDSQGHTSGYGYHYTTTYIDTMIDDQREWIDVDIEAIAESGTSLCQSTLRLQVSDVAPEPAFTLTSSAQEIFVNESVRFSADRPFTLYQTVPSEPVMRRVFGRTTVGDCTIDQAGTYTFIAEDSEGNRSNGVTVTAKSKGKLPAPSIYLNDELLDNNMPAFLMPGETCTLRIECSADDLTDPINRYGNLYFYNAENVNISTLNVQSETTFTVPEDAVRGHGNFNARATGWEGSRAYCSFICGVASDRFDSVTINGQPYVEGMTVAPYEDIRVSWNYITGAEYYNVTWTNGNGGYSERGCGSERNGMDFVFNASSSQITGTIRAIGDETELCTQTLRLNLSNVPAPSFQMSANVEETYLDSEVSLTWDREAILYVIEPDQVFAQENYAYVTSSQYTPHELGTYSFIARDKDGNFSNVVTVTCKSRGKLKVPALFFDGTKLKYGWNKDNPILTPGKTYEVTYAFTDAQPEGTYVDLEIYYLDNVGEYISEDYFELDPQPASITVPENVASMSMTVYVSAPGWEDVYAELEVQCGQVSSQLTNLRINSETLSGSATVPSYQPVRITYDYVTGAKEYVLYSPDDRSMRFGTQNSGLSFIPFVSGTYAFCLDALDENQEVISSETFTLTFTQSEPTFTITADRDRAPVEERIRFTSPVKGTWFFARAGLDATDEYQQNGNSQTASFEESYAGIWNAWCVTDDGHRSDVLTFEIYSFGALAEPQLLINGVKPEEARILPGDQVRFTLPAVEHADGYDLSVSASGFYRSYSSLEEINAVTFTAPDVNSLSVYMEVYGDGYERNYVNWEIPLIQSGVSGLKVNGVAPEQTVITPYVPTQVSLDAIPGATVYSVETAHSYSETDSQPTFEVVMLPGEQWLKVQASAGDEYDSSWTILAWDTVAVKVSDAVPAPAFQLDVQTATDGQGAKTLTFGVSGHANAVKDLYFLTPNGWIGSSRSDDAVWEFTMDMTGEYQFWAVDEANQISNIITMSNALKPVADLRINGGAPLSAGGTASVAFSAPENALTYSLQVVGVTAEGQRCLLLSTNGAYEAVNGASFYVPFSAVSVTCQVEAFADGYAPSRASASGNVAGTKSGYRLPASLRTIKEEAFSGVAAKLIVVPEGCETIGANAFAGSAVSEVFLPSSVSSVASNAFPEGTHIFRVYKGADATIDWTLE